MTRATIFKQYAQALGAVAAAGDAREESFYGALRDLLEQVADATSRPHVHVTVQPAPTDAGNPDFRLWNGTDSIIGYVEAKNPTQTDLAGIADTEQLRRYRVAYPNVLLTNFTEFRLYRNGQHVETVHAASPNILNDLHAAPAIERPTELWALLDQFLDFQLPQAPTAEELAIRLANLTRELRRILALQITQDDQAGGGRLSGFYEAFKQFLIADLTHEEFADLYAQTITYGLFAARTRATAAFTRRSAFDHIPHTIGVLRDVFRFVSLEDPPPQIEWVVDDIAEVLAKADAAGILDKYYREHKGSDPIVHFYETFLAQYNPEERERRGVYYTPEPVVSYIVRSLHSLLKSEFGMADGLASDGVTLLDPAAGTMTFVAEAARVAVAEFESKYGTAESARGEFIRGHILENFYAFELMMAPYAVGHLKMAFFLEELGHRLADDERVKFYLTNTLDMTELDQSHLPGLSSLSREAHLAGQVKKQTPILVILGNPPYSGHSCNQGDWIRGLIEDYKKVDGKALGEKNPKWLQDDYVKFLRFAQSKIDQAGRGIVGMITNHAYLDNPTFRGMRQSLMRTFDDIYVLDLHGNSLKREACPDGSLDGNVFDIRQGVAIALFVKRGGKKKESAKVQHADLWGTRESKFAWLRQHDRTCTTWRQLRGSSPSYLFVPRDNRRHAAFQRFPSLPDLFPTNSVGIVTARDHLTIQWTTDDAWRTVTVFSRMDPELARKGYRLGKDSQDWTVARAQQDIRESGPRRDNIAAVLYRPFDIRHTYYTGESGGFHCRPRPEIMRNMLQENVALVTPKRVEHVGAWHHAFVADVLADHVCVSLKTIDYVFPLYLYPNGERDLFAAMEPSERTPNLHPKLLDALKAAHCRYPTPEQVFHYVYAVLHAPAYRDKYAEFLRGDFPRVPFPKDAALFNKVAKLGERLTELHLLRSTELDTPAAHFGGQGDRKVAKGTKAGLRYDPAEQRVYINRSEHFAPVPQAVWDYRVGGYQVCEKWLKDRTADRGRGGVGEIGNSEDLTPPALWTCRLWGVRARLSGKGENRQTGARETEKPARLWTGWPRIAKRRVEAGGAVDASGFRVQVCTPYHLRLVSGRKLQHSWQTSQAIGATGAFGGRTEAYVATYDLTPLPALRAQGDKDVVEGVGVDGDAESAVDVECGEEDAHGEAEGQAAHRPGVAARAQVVAGGEGEGGDDDADAGHPARPQAAPELQAVVDGAQEDDTEEHLLVDAGSHGEHDVAGDFAPRPGVGERREVAQDEACGEGDGAGVDHALEQHQPEQLGVHAPLLGLPQRQPGQERDDGGEDHRLRAAEDVEHQAADGVRPVDDVGAQEQDAHLVADEEGEDEEEACREVARLLEVALHDAFGGAGRRGPVLGLGHGHTQRVGEWFWAGRLAAGRRQPQ